MTLNGVIAPSLCYFTEFGSFRDALRIKEVENTLMFSAAVKRQRNVVLATYHLLRYWQEITTSESVNVRHSPLASENLTNNQP